MTFSPWFWSKLMKNWLVHLSHQFITRMEILYSNIYHYIEEAVERYQIFIWGGGVHLKIYSNFFTLWSNIMPELFISISLILSLTITMFSFLISQVEKFNFSLYNDFIAKCPSPEFLLLSELKQIYSKIFVLRLIYLIGLCGGFKILIMETI